MEYQNFIKFDYFPKSALERLNQLGTIQIANDSLFTGILFESSSITLFFKDCELNEETIIAMAQRKIYTLLLSSLANGGNTSNFSMSVSELQLGSTPVRKFVYLRSTIGISTDFSVQAEIFQNGKNLSEDELTELHIANQRETAQRIISEASYMNFEDDQFNTFSAIFQISDPVIKYFVLYSWLVELCPNAHGNGSQRESETFIANTQAYTAISRVQRTRKKDNGEDVTEDIFTHLRNLIGHSINDCLCMDDKVVINDLVSYTPPLIRIIIEKLQQ